jgi:hypothetical protein
MSTAEQRRRWRAHFEESYRAFVAWEARGFDDPPPPPSEPLPEDLRGLTCGARTRAGTPRRRRDLYLSGRCPLHGGLSTGPRSREGKARAARNGCRPKRRKRTP